MPAITREPAVVEVMSDAAKLEVEVENVVDEVDVSAELASYVSKHEAEVRRRVDRRAGVEQRWIRALRQYHGKYDDETAKRMADNKQSGVFVNLTAPKTEAMEARLFDLLFPTDDRNWDVGPTPVPELSKQAEEALALASKAGGQADEIQGQIDQLLQQGATAETPEVAQLEGALRQQEGVETTAMSAADKLQGILQAAKDAAELMRAHIDDQLVQCNYHGEARDMIGDACRIGFGVIKGPLLNHRPRSRWSRGEDGMYTSAVVDDRVPGAYRVDPWSYFPDPDVKRVQDSQGHYERHFKNKSQLRMMAKRTDMDADAIRRLLGLEPNRGEVPGYMSTLHSITGSTDGDMKDRYVVWEYTGPADGEDLALLARLFEMEDILELDPETGEIDPLQEQMVRMWFCQGEVLSFALHPLDSGSSIYNSFTIREDETSPFGYGIPDIMEDIQSILNAAYRMMMDNSGLGAGPQVLINSEAVEPENGDWTLTPRKIWKMNTAAMSAAIPPISMINIDTHQQELMNIIQLAAQTIDEVTAMPALAQGEQGTGVTKTAQGMAILMNSANVSFRRIVKNFDDNITTPLIRSMYDWNMQFGEDEAIKGDYEVQARGASVLLVREMQATNLVMIAQLFGDHPVYGPMIRHSDLLKNIFRAMMIAADDVLLSESEHAKKMEEMAAQPDPAMAALEMEKELKAAEHALRREEMQANVSIANMEKEGKMRAAELDYAGKMQIAVENFNLKQADIEAGIAKENLKQDSKERIVAVETAIARETGQHAGGNI